VVQWPGHTAWAAEQRPASAPRRRACCWLGAPRGRAAWSAPPPAPRPRRRCRRPPPRPSRPMRLRRPSRRPLQQLPQPQLLVQRLAPEPAGDDHSKVRARAEPAGALQREMCGKQHVAAYGLYVIKGLLNL